MNFFKSLARTMGTMLTSKKFLTSALSTVAALTIKDPSVRNLVVGVGGAYILGQGAADFGKSAAAVVPTEPPAP